MSTDETETPAFTDQEQDDIVASLGEPEIAARSQKLHDAQEAWEEAAYLHNPKMPCPECTGAGSVGGGSLGDICVRCMGMRVIDQPGSEPLKMPPFAQLRAAIGAYGDALADHALPSGHRAKKYLPLPAAATVPTMESIEALYTQALDTARQLAAGGAPGIVPKKQLAKAKKTKGMAGEGDLGDYEDAELADMEKEDDL